MQSPEIELKLRIEDPALYSQIVSDDAVLKLCLSDKADEYLFENTYYDTDSLVLSEHHLSLRLRSINGKQIATVIETKAMAGGLCRHTKWSAAAENYQAPEKAFGDAPIGEKLRLLLGGNALSPLCKTVCKRIVRILEIDGCPIELVAEQGQILAGGRSTPLCEIQLKRKDGGTAGLFQTGALLAERYPLRIERASQFQRGLLLAGYEKAQPENEVSEADGTQTVKSALANRLIAQTDAVFAAFDHYSQNPDSPKAIHTFRVSLRCLRTLIVFAKPVMVPSVYQKASKKLRTISNAFGPVREHDVLLKKWRAIMQEQNLTSPETMNLETFLCNQRQDACHQLQTFLSEHSVTAALLAFSEVLPDAAWSKKAEADYQAFSKKRIHKWMRQAKAACTKKTILDTAKAHRLRIRCKKIHCIQTVLIFDKPMKGVFKKNRLDKLLIRLGRLHDADRNIFRVTQLIQLTDADTVIQEGKRLIKAEKKARNSCSRKLLASIKNR